MTRLNFFTIALAAGLLASCANYIPAPQYQDYYVPSQYKSPQMSPTLSAIYPFLNSKFKYLIENPSMYDHLRHQ